MISVLLGATEGLLGAGKRPLQIAVLGMLIGAQSIISVSTSIPSAQISAPIANAAASSVSVTSLPSCAISSPGSTAKAGAQAFPAISTASCLPPGTAPSTGSTVPAVCPSCSTLPPGPVPSTGSVAPCDIQSVTCSPCVALAATAGTPRVISADLTSQSSAANVRQFAAVGTNGKQAGVIDGNVAIAGNNFAKLGSF